MTTPEWCIREARERAAELARRLEADAPTSQVERGFDADLFNGLADALASALSVQQSGEGMKDLTIAEVQHTNRLRADRWHDGDFREWSGLEWAGAMCGEAGEAANVAKKMRRLELQYRFGNAASERPSEDTEELRAHLGKECADTFLYLTLLASRYDIDLTAAVVATFNAKSEQMDFPERLSDSMSSHSSTSRATRET
jgi:NTP pyrophosphatase (non-canonical NTP hydrolase)